MASFRLGCGPPRGLEVRSRLKGKGWRPQKPPAVSGRIRPTWACGPPTRRKLRKTPALTGLAPHQCGRSRMRSRMPGAASRCRRGRERSSFQSRRLAGGGGGRAPFRRTGLAGMLNCPSEPPPSARLSVEIFVMPHIETRDRPALSGDRPCYAWFLAGFQRFAPPFPLALLGPGRKLLLCAAVRMSAHLA